MTDIKLLKTTEKRYQVLETMNITSLEDVVMISLKKLIPMTKMIKSLLKQQLSHQQKSSLKGKCQECHSW